ncbi:MAG: hypothetical protein ACI91O_001149 [Candidatus Poriferisodalaceae bacterium]|jgi:hypothetical protein
MMLTGLDELVETQANELPPELRLLLAQSAALGQHFTTAEVAAALAAAEPEVEQALMDARDLGVLTEHQGRFRFAHDIWQSHFYRALAPSQRTTLHN